MLEDEHHLKLAEIASISPDVLIIESTHGVSKNEGRIDREFRFIQNVTRIVERGGRDLIPIFALGRVQKLLIISGRTLLCACSRFQINFSLVEFMTNPFHETLDGHHLETREGNEQQTKNLKIGGCPDLRIAQELIFDR